MDILQDYFQTVLARVEDIKTATLLMAGYEQGKKAAERSPFGSQTANPPQSAPFRLCPKKAATAQILPLSGVLDEKTENKTRGSYVLPDKKASAWGVLLLTEKELQRMPKKFRPDFRVGNIVAHVRQKSNGVYEIRCQIKKQKIEVSSKILDVAKQKFIDALRAFEAGSLGAGGSRSGTPEHSPVPAPLPPVSAPSVTLGEYMLKWLETVRKPNVKAITYKQYMVHYRTNICPVLGARPITEIKPFEVQEFINSLMAEGKKQTAKNVNMLLCGVFSYAVIDDIIAKSPMLKIKIPHFEKKESVPFTREEEKEFVALLENGGRYAVQAYVFMLYTGLRRSELASVKIEGDWITVISAKNRKGFKDKIRAIPVSPMLKRLLPLINIERIKRLNVSTLTVAIKKYFPNHHAHELRHTFITRCQECGIRREIVSLWSGHAADSSVTSSVYTHLETNKNIQIEEIKKFYYEL